MSRMARICAAVLFFFLAVAENAASQTMTIVPNAGISKDMRSETEDYWNMGFNAGLNVFFQTSELISFGGRVAYHHWGVDGNGWAREYTKDAGSSYSYTVESSTGSQSVIEIVPSLRIAASRSKTLPMVHLELGAALLFVMPSDVTLSGRYSSYSSSGSAQVTFKNESMTGYGFQAGLPVSFPGVLQILPLYTLYWAGGDAYHHFAMNIGIDFAK